MINTSLNYRTSQGAAVLLTMAALLFVCSLVVLTGAKSIKANTMVVRNQLHEDQAFEAAEAGIEYGLVHLKENRSAILVDDDENGGSGDGYIDAYATALTQNVDNGNGTNYSIVYSNPTANDFDITLLTVTGTSDGGNVTKIINQQAIRIPYLQILPPAGLISHDDISLGGNVTVTNTTTGTTIWSGGRVQLSGSASTDGGNGVSSDRRTTDSDIVQNDRQLSSLTGDEFFQAMLGTDKATAEANADIILNYSSSQNLSSVLDPDSNNGKAIWVNQTGGTARFSGNATIGTQDEPVVLIINGDFKANGTTDIWGVVYITQDWHNTGGGTLTIHGAVIVEGAFSGTGTPNVIYDALTLQNTREIAEFARIPGSWRDF